MAPDGGATGRREPGTARWTSASPTSRSSSSSTATASRRRSSGPRPSATTASRQVPYEIVAEARRRGLHGFDLLTKMATDDEGLFGVIYAEELHWGCAGIALAISASSLAAAGIAASGTPEQIQRWVPECYGIGDEIKFGAYAVTEPSRRLRRQVAAHDRQARRRRVGPQRHQGLHLQRRDRRRHGRRGAHVDPSLGHRGQASFVVPKGTPGLLAGQEGGQARHPRLADDRGRARGLPHPARPPARRDGQARAQARARPLGPVAAAPPTRSRRSRSRARSSAPARSGSRAPPTSATLDLLEGRADEDGAAARAAARPAGDRRRRDRDRRRAPARPARRLDGAQRRRR